MRLYPGDEAQHTVIDAKHHPNLLNLHIAADVHGLTIELPNGQFITVDYSGSVLSVYHNETADDGTKLLDIKIDGEPVAGT